MKFTWKIPNLNTEGAPTTIEIGNGSVIFLVGANGSGKSALVTQLAKSTREIKTVRIAAHRQSWLHSNSVDLTPKGRKDLNTNITQRDKRDDSRWKDDFAQPRTQVAIFDLVNAQNSVSRQALELLKQDNIDEATRVAKLPSPLEAMNDILAVSALSVRLSINDEGDILARHFEGPQFSISQLSDGERNAVMLAAQVLTAEPGSLFLIDEPERHLHRSITEPMLSALFEKRQDCGFVIATHEPELPNSNPSALVGIVRSCSWNGVVASGWDLDILEPGLDIPDDIRKALLGSRRRLLFIEGEAHSLDYPLISALFPELSIKPTGGCKEVERSVIGLANTTGIHWLKPLGLVDRDDRTDAEVAELASNNIFALEVSAIESLFYSEVAIDTVARAQAAIHGVASEELSGAAKTAALATLDQETKENLAARRSEKAARNQALSRLPDWKEIKGAQGQDMNIAIETTFEAELRQIEAAIAETSLDSISNRFAIKKTRLPSEIAAALRFANKRHYEEAVVTIARKDDNFADALRSKLSSLRDHLVAQD